MPVITVSVPEPKTDPLLKQLLSQFASIQRQLQGIKEKPDSSSKVMSMMMRQQDSMMNTMDKIIGIIASNKSSDSDAILDAMRGIRKSLADLPSDMHSMMKKSMPMTGNRQPSITVKPQVTVSMDNLTDKFNSLEAAILSSKSRNRTFGSNY